MTENIHVALRFRPLNQKEVGTPACVTIRDTLVEVTGSEKHQFTFDYVFGPDSSQESVFETLARKAVDFVSKGYNATIFTYGSTGSGKTYTMFGSGNERGIIPRTCEYLFQAINNEEDVVQVSIRCSFLEIYQEKLRDLLDTQKKWAENLPINYNPELQIRQTDKKGVYVQGLIEKFVYSPEDILAVIQNGADQRAVTSTALNNVSSRSHAVLTIFVTQTLTDGSESYSKLHLIDLAGSENVGKSEVQGTALNEAKMINKSLSSLGNVISALTEQGSRHIPYRDSKLTYLLQDSLGGNSKTILITTASMSAQSYSETLNALKFARRAKEIKNLPKLNRNESHASLVQTIQLLQARISELERQNTEKDALLQVVERTDKESREAVLARARCVQLESHIQRLNAETDKDREKYSQLQSAFEEQRDLSVKTGSRLTLETVRNSMLKRELDKHKFFQKSVQDTIDISSEALVRLLKTGLARLDETDSVPEEATD